ncbi:zinc finger MYM-type protein 5-like [Hydra vulgaris]|uniref:Zinc finger MYM-type protein 5-like n=1 Tax=Hydra vulgaris TaxID=6087 RepID=A0ABM4D0E5_HYDVU
MAMGTRESTSLAILNGRKSKGKRMHSKKMKGSLLKYVNKVDATSSNDTSINSFVSSTSPGIVISEPEPMLTDTVEQCGCAMSFTSEPVIQADAEPPVADLGLGIRNSKESISNDPAEWEINADLIAYYAENIPSQNLKSDLSLKGRQFSEKIRYVCKECFIRKLVNGEIVSRDWLIYSPSTGKVFCYICKIFGCKTAVLVIFARYLVAKPAVLVLIMHQGINL